jgi:hypothetical protein
MVTLGARMTAGIRGTHKNIWFTWLVCLESGGTDSTRCDHVQDTHDAVIVHATYFVQVQSLEVCNFSKLIDHTNLVSQVFSLVLTHDFSNP